MPPGQLTKWQPHSASRPTVWRSRYELFALIEFAEERTVEKLQTRAVLKALAAVWPPIVSHPP